MNDSSTVSSQPPDSDTSSRDGNDASSSDDGAPTPTAARTAARQIGAHMSGPGDGDEIRQGRARTQTMALNREAAAGRNSTIGPCEEDPISHALYWQRKPQAVNPHSYWIAFSNRWHRNRRLTPRRVRQFTPVFGQRQCKLSLMD